MSNNKKNVWATYNPMWKIYPLIAWPLPSITNSLPWEYWEPTLENLLIAQEKKHQHYFKQLDLGPWKRLLDVGCGWWPFLTYCRDRGVETVWLTLSSVQYEYLQKEWYEVYYSAWQDFSTDVRFDAVSAIWSIEHFVSPDNVFQWKQDDVYKHLFDKVSWRLKPWWRFGGQFMTWWWVAPNYDLVKSTRDILHKDNDDWLFTQRLDTEPTQVKQRLYAEKWSKYYHIALLSEFYPWAWLPRDFQHFYESWKDDYTVLETIDWRDHYIWTMACRWNQFRKFLPLKKWLYVWQLLPKLFTDRSFQLWAKAFREKSNRLCFINNRMWHEFFFLQKKS